MTPRTARVGVVALAGQTAGPLPAALVGVFAVDVTAALGFGDPGLGAVVATLFAVSAVAAVPAGHLADRLGWQQAVRLGAAASAAALVGMATAGHLSVLLVAAGVGGLGLALASTGTNLALAVEVASERRGLAFGIKQSAFPLATLLAGASLPLLAAALGWRWVLGGAALVPLLALVATPAAAARSHRQARRRPATAGQEGRRADPSFGGLLLLAAAGCAGIAGAGTLGAFLVVSSVAAGMAAGTAGTLVAVGSAVGLTTRVLAGWAADRLDRGGLRAVAALLAVCAAGTALLVPAVPALIVPGALLALGPGWGWGGLIRSGVVRAWGGADTGRATGIVESGMNGGAAAGPLLFGLLAAQSGYAGAWTATAVLFAAAAALAWSGARLLRVRPRDPDDQMQVRR